MRVAGITLPDNKRVDISLTYLYGVGRSNVYEILKKAEVDPAKRMKDISEEEANRLLRILDEYKVEGELRADLVADIKRLKEISSFRGVRHAHNLPARGQRTRSNARTKRGKRMTIGAIKKDVAERMGLLGAPAAAKK